MRLSTSVPLSALVTSTVATNLYVSSYLGNVTTLHLSKSAEGAYSLESASVNNECGPSPSWLTRNENNGVIYCLDENWAGPNGTVFTYKASESGELTQVDKHVTLGGPVSGVVYNKGKAYAVAHYSGFVTTFSIVESGGLQPLQNFTFSLAAPGPNPDRQEKPHPHEAILDPTDAFVVVPDLGADLLRVFSIDPETSQLKESKPFSTPPGSGPRHGSFVKSGENTFFFLITELSNTILSYKVTYDKDQLNFAEVFSAGTYGNITTPVGAAAAEAIVSPDGKFVLTSSRNDTHFQIPNFDPKNSTELPSDTLQSWSICTDTGKLKFVQLSPAGGRFPRHFSVNKSGTLAAVAAQKDERVVIVERNVEDGTYGKFVAEIHVPGEVSAVIWGEEKAGAESAPAQ